MTLTTLFYTGHAMGTEVKLLIVAEDKGAGEEAICRAVCDLEETEQALSRFREDSDLSVLNREGEFRCDTRDEGGRPPAGVFLRRSERLPTPTSGRRGYWTSASSAPSRRSATVSRFLAKTSAPLPPSVDLGPVDMRNWIDEEQGTMTLPRGVRIDLAGVGKALGIGWAACRLAGHAGLLVDVGGDVVALGCDDTTSLGRSPYNTTASEASFRATLWPLPPRPQRFGRGRLTDAKLTT